MTTDPTDSCAISSTVFLFISAGPTDKEKFTVENTWTDPGGRYRGQIQGMSPPSPLPHQQVPILSFSPMFLPKRACIIRRPPPPNVLPEICECFIPEKRKLLSKIVHLTWATWC